MGLISERFFLYREGKNGQEWTAGLRILHPESGKYSSGSAGPMGTPGTVVNWEEQWRQSGS
jgi:hypothetical protein